MSCLLFCKSKEGLGVVVWGLNSEMMIITLFCCRKEWPNKYAMLIIIQMIVIPYISTGLPYFSSTLNLWFHWLHTPSYAGINTVIFFSMLTHLCVSFDHHNQRGKHCYSQFNQGRNWGLESFSQAIKLDFKPKWFSAKSRVYSSPQIFIWWTGNMEEIDHVCLVSHLSHLMDRSHNAGYEATANETLLRAFVWTANPVHFQKLGS